MDEQSTSTVDAKTAQMQADNPDPDNQNGKPRVLQRMETVPDIKRDTSGITTQYIGTGIG